MPCCCDVPLSCSTPFPKATAAPLVLGSVSRASGCSTRSTSLTNEGFVPPEAYTVLEVSTVFLDTDGYCGVFVDADGVSVAPGCVRGDRGGADGAGKVVLRCSGDTCELWELGGATCCKCGGRDEAAAVEALRWGPAVCKCAGLD